MSASPDTTETPKTSWRVTLGTWMFTIPFVMFFGALVVIPLLGLSVAQAAAAIGGVVVAAEVIWFASIPLLGKQGFLAMKKKAFGFLKLKADPISESRHKLGVNCFWIGLSGQPTRNPCDLLDAGNLNFIFDTSKTKLLTSPSI
jgi:hypothetical protein